MRLAAAVHEPIKYWSPSTSVLKEKRGLQLGVYRTIKRYMKFKEEAVCDMVTGVLEGQAEEDDMRKVMETTTVRELHRGIKSMEKKYNFMFEEDTEECKQITAERKN